MKVDRIEIRNYKGFESCDVDFHPNMNVFIGSNASGKTTLLSAILKSVSQFSFRVTNVYNENLQLGNNDVNYNENYASINSFISNFKDVGVNFNSFVNIGAGNELKKPQTIEMHFNKIIHDFKNKIGISPITIPIIKFYPANRGSITYTEVHNFNNFKISQLEAWSNIYQDTLSYSKFFHWFFENETAELRLQRDSNDFKIQSPDLRDIRKALELAFEELGYGSYSLLSKQIKRAGNAKLLPALFLKNKKTNKEESLDNKSDGEKAIITLIADIAYNLSIAKDFVSDDDFLKSPGIVMIDEIETHLHPKWQREILPILIKIFPNIQFFVATHSPQVVASVSSECVFICDNFKVDGVHLKTLGEDTNSLLKYIFEATDRPKEYVKLIEQIDIFIEQNKSPEEIKKVIHAIELKYNQEDKASGLSNLIDDLNIRLAAYEFDRDYEKNN
ncbi:AAA family ATPase [Flavobacterium sp.]|uniref:AAA family ATPase n=1 Tax=Flavobacterium sp. TaxID=239 RepID=UPI00262F2BE6|nr:AAA family ATPase [Flavobacterium sp.]